MLTKKLFIFKIMIGFVDQPKKPATAVTRSIEAFTDFEAYASCMNMMWNALDLEKHFIKSIELYETFTCN